MTLLAYSPVGAGMLTGKYSGDATPAGSRRENQPDLNGRMTPRSVAATEAYLAIARRHGLDPAQMALAFVNRQPFVTSNIIGATTMDQLKTNIDSIDVQLSPQVLADIDKVRRDFPIPY